MQLSAAVDIARDQDLHPAVRGGHNAARQVTCHDGLVSDLSMPKGIRVGPAQRAVRADGGCTWVDLSHATQRFGLAALNSIVSTTGIAGLAYRHAN